MVLLTNWTFGDVFQNQNDSDQVRSLTKTNFQHLFYYLFELHQNHRHLGKINKLIKKFNIELKKNILIFYGFFKYFINFWCLKLLIK